MSRELEKGVIAQIKIASALAGLPPDDAEAILTYVLAGLGLAAGYDKKAFAGQVLTDLDNAWRFQKAKALCPGGN